MKNIIHKRNNDLTVGEPIKAILLFAIPLFIGQLFHLLYTIVDTRMVGEILGEKELAAVGATTTVCDMLIGFMNGVTNGFAIVIAWFYGAKDEEGLRKAHGSAFVYGMGLTVLLSALGLIFLKQILWFLNVSPNLEKDASLYLGIMMAGLLTSVLYNWGASSLRAIGDSFTPLIFLIVSSVLNIILDYISMAVLSMGVEGAALATILAQAVSALCCIVYMRKKYAILRLRFRDISFDKEMTGRLFSAGLGMGFMISFVQIGTVVLQTAINTFENATIVAHTAARKATSLFMLPFSVLGSALATFTGQNLGAKKHDRIRQGLKKTVLCTWGWCIIVFAINLLAAPFIAHLITASDNREILDTAASYLRFNTAFYFITAVISIFRNTMQGFGDTKTPLFSSAIELVGKVLITFFLAPMLGYWGIIISEPIVWSVMVIPLIVNMFRSEMWKLSGKKEIDIS